MPLLAPHERISRPQAIADLLRRRIVSGELPVGSRLPSVRKLAHLQGVSIPTAHAAIQCLVAIGLVRSVHGVGTFVERPTGSAAALNHAWLHASWRELVAMRMAIDERAATMAAGAMASPRTVDRPATATLSLIHLLAREVAMSRFGDVEEFVAADRRFHQTVVASLRGLESTAAIRDRIDRRLARWWALAALQLAPDTDFHEAHLELAAAILDGRIRASAAISRRLARRESDAMSHAVGAAIR